MEDFLELAAIASNRRLAPLGPPHDGVPELPAVEDVEEQEEDEEREGFLQLALLASRDPARHKPVQRSHEHTARARAARALKKEEGKTAAAKEAATSAKRSLAMVSMASGSAAGREAVEARKVLADDEVSIFRMHVACEPAQRGDSRKSHIQAVCACRAASAIQSIQQDALHHHFLGGCHPTEGVAPASRESGGSVLR